ncbi:MAG: hypothetical protein JEZ07_09495 [Phycisphaerae bacterium]|nr:hypothetical protein [Phycisphaerae bacterium]
MKTKLLCMLLLLGFCSPLLATVPLNEIPQDTKWIAHIDIGAIGNTEMYRICQNDAKYADFLRAMDKINDKTGLNLPEDLQSITIFGDNFQEERGMIIARGFFDVDKIGDAVMDKVAWTESYYGRHTIYNCTEQAKYKAFLVCYISQEYMLVTKQKDLMEKTLDVIDRKRNAKNATNSEIANNLANLPAGTIFTAAVTEMPKGKSRPQGQPNMMQNVNKMTVVAGESNGKVFMKMEAICNTAENAANMAQMGNGILAMAKMYAPLPEAQDLLNAMTITADGDRLICNFSFDSDKFIANMKVVGEKARQMKSAGRARR